MIIELATFVWYKMSNLYTAPVPVNCHKLQKSIFETIESLMRLFVTNDIRNHKSFGINIDTLKSLRPLLNDAEDVIKIDTI